MSLIVVFALIGISYLFTSYPKVERAPKLKIEATPERLIRGKYLAHDVAGCIDCHSKRDMSKYSAPIVAGTEGMGGMEFNKTLGDIPGIIYAKNITPSGIGDWTDGELFRAITTGVNKKGEALFPLMPFLHYRKMSEEDLYSIIAYIRTLKQIDNTVPERSLDFPMNLIVRTIPTDMPKNFPALPLKSDSVTYGEYMVNASACMACHSKFVKGKIDPGMEYAGGFTFCFPDGVCVTSSNITPDKETGIGLLTKEAFLDKFRFYRAENAQNIPVGNGGNKTVMPWVQMSSISDEDLGAMYVYLKTLKPVKNRVEKFSKAK
jgi:hypothetical protein